MSDIDTVLVDSLKALDPKRPIREADIHVSAPVASTSILPISVVSNRIRWLVRDRNPPVRRPYCCRCVSPGTAGISTCALSLPRSG